LLLTDHEFSRRGLGAGAGNAATELPTAVLDLMGLDSGLDVVGLPDAPST
jgi:4-hydroxy 2-oxovalerate aldolase